MFLRKQGFGRDGAGDVTGGGGLPVGIQDDGVDEAKLGGGSGIGAGALQQPKRGLGLFPAPFHEGESGPIGDTGRVLLHQSGGSAVGIVEIPLDQGAEIGIGGVGIRVLRGVGRPFLHQQAQAFGIAGFLVDLGEAPIA